MITAEVAIIAEQEASFTFTRSLFGRSIVSWEPKLRAELAVKVLHLSQA